MNDIITVKDLQLWYGQTKALKGVSMNIPEKSITALIGPSGCGKSTFLKTLDRMNDLIPGVRIEGEVKYNGQDIFAPSVDVNELRREIGMVFQKPNPFPMSIYDNIAYGPRTHGVRKKDELDEIVEQSLRGAAIWDEVKDRLKKSALGLSGGQQQRLCIARAGRAAAGSADGRADECARPHLDLQDRGACHESERTIYDHHRHAQHAAGAAHFGQDGVFPAGRAHRIRRHAEAVLPAEGEAHRGLHHREVRIMRSKFDQQLALLNEELTQMGETCAKAICLAAQALEAQDAATAAPVAELEEQTNEQERSIEALCLKLLLQQQPVARDLRQISAALKMITDMERIGDQAADIAEIIPFFLSHNTFDCTLVCRMAQQASSMVTQSVDAFVRRDVDLARSIAKQDDLVDEDFSNVKQALIAAIAREPGQGEVALDLLMIAKYFERIGDHAVNLSEWVEFSVTGMHKHDGVEYE